MKPRIAIPLPTSSDLDYNRRNWQVYADCVSAAAAEPVRFDLDLSARAILKESAGCQAILLPGSPADVDPETYGQPRNEATAPADLPRETLDRLLLEDAYAARRPILGICFGAQILNVFRGGTLIQDLTVMPVNHSAGSSVAVAHTIDVARDSLLAGVIDPLEALIREGFCRLPINSSHHQAVGVPGTGLRVSARCPQDAVVEALEGTFDSAQDLRHFVLGVQWHPERTTAASKTSQSLFARLVQEASIWQEASAAGR